MVSSLCMLIFAAMAGLCLVWNRCRAGLRPFPRTFLLGAFAVKATARAAESIGVRLYLLGIALHIAACVWLGMEVDRDPTDNPWAASPLPPRLFALIFAACLVYFIVPLAMAQRYVNLTMPKRRVVLRSRERRRSGRRSKVLRVVLCVVFVLMLARMFGDW